MWIAHFAQGREQLTYVRRCLVTDKHFAGLIAKPFVPRVPLAVLTLAGALPDVIFFVLQFFGIETFNFDRSIAAHAGCFPYTNDYPFSHSLIGMVISGRSLSYPKLRSSNQVSLIRCNSRGGVQTVCPGTCNAQRYNCNHRDQRKPYPP